MKGTNRQRPPDKIKRLRGRGKIEKNRGIIIDKKNRFRE